MSVVRSGAKPTNVTFTKKTVKSGSTTIVGAGVFFDGSGNADVAVAGSKCFGVATEAVVGDGTKQCEVALLAGGGTVRVKLSSTATEGEYAIAGSGGFENQTLGGGTTVRHIAGKFLESGVVGDFVEMIPLCFAAGSA